MKTIGVLGGLGPQATIDFEMRVHEVSQRLIPQRANRGYPPMVVYYHREAPVLTNPDDTPVFPMQPHPTLFEKLPTFGALVDFIVITANGPHLLKDQIEAATGRKVLSMVELAVQEVIARGWKKAGLITLGEPHVYRAPLDRLGIAHEGLVGDLAEMRQRVDRALISVMEGKAGVAEREIALEAVATLRERGTDGIVLGCTELPLLLGDTALDPDLINPAALLAEAAVRYAMVDN